MITKSLLLIFFTSIVITVPAEQLYLNVRTGNDSDVGSKSHPLKTLFEAAKRINANSKVESSVIVLSEGVYPITETILFNNNKYSSNIRLIIRAEIMPDDSNWNPQKMPILVMMIPTVPNSDGEEAKGIDVEVSHVTIEGIWFSGGPLYYYIDGKHNRRSYPIWRYGKNLEDLLVTQCMFTGDPDLLPVRVAAIANGQKFVLDHCVFYHCQNPVVFWNADSGESNHNAMRYCLVYEPFYSGVWTTQSTGDDFEFHHNIIAGSGKGWISEGAHHYSIHDCIFTGNTYPSGNLSGLKNDIKAGSTDFLKMVNVQLTGTIEIEKDQSKKNYLQLKEGAFGTHLKTGLFKN